MPPPINRRRIILHINMMNGPFWRSQLSHKHWSYDLDQDQDAQKARRSHGGTKELAARGSLSKGKGAPWSTVFFIDLPHINRWLSDLCYNICICTRVCVWERERVCVCVCSHDLRLISVISRTCLSIVICCSIWQMLQHGRGSGRMRIQSNNTCGFNQLSIYLSIYLSISFYLAYTLNGGMMECIGSRVGCAKTQNIWLNCSEFHQWYSPSPIGGRSVYHIAHPPEI